MQIERKPTYHAEIKTLQQKFRLPCGVELPNRICKSAMSENMADEGGKPSQNIYNLYKIWGESQTGLIITGNVMIDSRSLGEPYNVVIEDERHLAELKKWVEVCQSEQSHLWMQINHPGRQTPKSLKKEAVSPSDVQLSQKALFAKPRALKNKEVYELVERYGNTAQIAKKAGFAGVQIHGAHGYLVSQFLSPLTNLRTDEWGGSLEKRAKFVLEVYKNMRSKVGDDYPVGIKINSADFQRGGFSEEESMEVVDMLSEIGIDLIEVSGGTYEKAAMMGVTQKESTLKREAYFLEYIEKVRKRTQTPLMLTGGFRTLEVMAKAIKEDKVDIVGLARPFVWFPHFPKEFFLGIRNNCFYEMPKVGLKFIDKMGFVDTIWHSKQLLNIAKGKGFDYTLSGKRVLWQMFREQVGF